jgi:hypothetical protein
MSKTMLFNAYTGSPRHLSDIQSDPEGILILDPDAPMRAAAPPAPSVEPVACGACNGSGCMVRDPDIGTDQECFVCDGTGVSDDSTPPDHLAAMRQALDALEQLQGGCTDSDDGTVEAITVWCPEVIDALRAALEGKR